ncbi:MAG: hypothetical protein IPN40_00185 [Uliginosibacterium sp.]|nr:hypothetical protein [Uliginosibacterium sp.]
MSSLNFIGGEKAASASRSRHGCWPSIFIDKARPSPASTPAAPTPRSPVYADYAAPVVVDSYEGLDQIAGAFRGNQCWTGSKPA